MPMYSSYGSSFGGSSMYGYPSGGGYDLGGTWRPHTGRSEWVASDYGRGYPGAYGGYSYPYDSMYEAPYNYALHSNHYPSPVDYYGSYNSLAMYEEQLRLMQGITEAERLARWQARIQFEELCEEERALRYSLMAEEERMRLGLWGDSHWASRYGGGGYNMPVASSYPTRLSPWHSSRLPLSSSLSSRYSPMYGSTMGGYGLGYPSSAYGGSLTCGPISRSHTRQLLKAEVDEARRLRRHEIQHARQARRLMLSH
ncbi:hypothetical protein PGT21_007779 [Puccinia graminis f. sp. tritici]|uniref:Uncharacterized protein n=1 Tax=Puccinia graminis f. sp. tritici TaxID=56615 RepID=A0A5B0NAF8_PUCGR|nr:hypothetical protein PGT21_008662 [Puccinia graminis f. sp. tritici]KAA1085454.1 hypothetical protein PGT21_007779 [Puccinia graminis f. sp. tritici]KAA1122953.1 hypothetical protein PGTUg99_007600 [Puccinia graminis f. sp. tritici]